MKIVKMYCDIHNADADLIFWIGSGFVQVNKDLEIIQSNNPSFSVGDVVDKKQFGDLILSSNEIKFETKDGEIPCAEIHLDDGTTFYDTAKYFSKKFWMLMDETVVEEEKTNNDNSKLPNIASKSGNPFKEIVCSICGSNDVKMFAAEPVEDDCKIDNICIGKSYDNLMFEKYINHVVLGCCEVCQDEALLKVTMNDGTIFDEDENAACQYALKNWDNLITRLGI